MTTTNSQAFSAYAASSRLTASPRDVLASVHEELYRAIGSAKFAHEQGRLDQMCRHAMRATQILTVLSTSLDFSAAGPDGKTLRSFYQYVLDSMVRASRRKDVSNSYQILLDLLRPFCKELRSEK
jgi:flagellin-specific chaperone FliS